MKFKGKINVFTSEIFNKYIYKNINNKNIKNIYKLNSVQHQILNKNL